MEYVFWGRLIQSNGKTVVTDHLGSVRATEEERFRAYEYYPYGENIGFSPRTDGEQFATYTREAGTGLDYADQRYYASTYGRFATPDPGSSSASSPGSWNRYPYVIGDPVNLVDPRGRCGHPGTGYFDEDGGLDFDYFSGCADGSDDVDPCRWNPYDASCGSGGLGSPGGGLPGAGLPGGGNSLAPTPGVGPAIPGIAESLREILGAIFRISGRIVTGVPGAIVIAITNPTPAGGWGDTFPSVQQVRQQCTARGDQVIVPATRRGNRDGFSIEQEYICPDGLPYTIHTLVGPDGNILDEHVRPGSPKYGPPHSF